MALRELTTIQNAPDPSGSRDPRGALSERACPSSRADRAGQRHGQSSGPTPAPRHPRCAVIVTSRRHLAGLDDATHITLRVLGNVEAVELFRSLAGDRAGPADQATTERTVDLCGRLALAIRIAAARLRQAPARHPRTLCTELEHAPRAGQGSTGSRAGTAPLMPH